MNKYEVLELEDDDVIFCFAALLAAKLTESDSWMEIIKKHNPKDNWFPIYCLFKKWCPAFTEQELEEMIKISKLFKKMRLETDEGMRSKNK